MSATKTSSKSAGSDDVSESFDRLMDQLGRLRDDLSEIQGAAKDLAKAGATEGRDRLQSEIEEMTRRIAELSSELEARGHNAARKAGAKASELSGELESTINRNPLAAVLIAVGLGFLIGMASRGRS
ncbi:hypothetical protein [Microbaculum marinum]|uniref:DUF883 domain-containing protein n=1 Tax=Microbaculum marinum TaxID=1764581 RepID=A0AAW9RG85_9HYPH